MMLYECRRMYSWDPWKVLGTSQRQSRQRHNILFCVISFTSVQYQLQLQSFSALMTTFSRGVFCLCIVHVWVFKVFLFLEYKCKRQHEMSQEAKHIAYFSPTVSVCVNVLHCKSSVSQVSSILSSHLRYSCLSDQTVICSILKCPLAMLNLYNVFKSGRKSVFEENCGHD